MAIVRLAFLSVLNRRVTAGLTLLAIALSVAMLLGVEKVRRDARGTFTNTISGTGRRRETVRYSVPTTRGLHWR